MTKNLKIETGRSSSMLTALLGNIDWYVGIMEEKKVWMTKKYPNPYLAKVFSLLPKKLITIGPMSYCDNLLKDLGGSADKEVLAAIGLSNLWITTHDDVVDETPEVQPELAALIYAGNLALIEGIKILLKKNLNHLADSLLSTIAENHYRQQFRVDLLWEKKPKNFKDYRQGIEDLVSLVAIGPRCALALLGQEKLDVQIYPFYVGYGVAIQIIDDIREREEDKISGYHSFPLLEGKPFARSFAEAKKHLKMAQKALDPRWRNMNQKVVNLGLLLGKLQKEFV